MKKTLEELENIVSQSNVTLPLDFVIRTMKVLELAQESMGNGEQRDLVGEYANSLFHEVSNFISSDELTEVEENHLL